MFYSVLHDSKGRTEGGVFHHLPSSGQMGWKRSLALMEKRESTHQRNFLEASGILSFHGRLFTEVVPCVYHIANKCNHIFFIMVLGKKGMNKATKNVKASVLFKQMQRSFCMSYLLLSDLDRMKEDGSLDLCGGKEFTFCIKERVGSQGHQIFQKRQQG